MNNQMNNQLTIRIGNNDIPAFLCDGFYSTEDIVSRLHSHYHDEIHILGDGCGSIALSSKTVTIKGSCVVIIPKNTPHCFTETNDINFHAAFQINTNCDKFRYLPLNSEISKLFFEERNKVCVSNDHTLLAHYLSLICQPLFDKSNIKISPISDYEFIINEFFSLKYSRNVTISDLAEELHLSEKQTERLVIKYTGMTFKKMLIHTRMATARHMENTTDLPLSKIAEYVGYSSYSGFWKAYKDFS